MRSPLQILKDILLLPVDIVIHTIKVDVGINGTYWDYDSWVPEGIWHSMVGNTIIAFVTGHYLGYVGEPSVWPLLGFFYSFGMGFFVFPALRWYLDIHFPTGRGFYLPRNGPPVDTK